MRAQHVTVALIALLPGAILTASCIQVPPETDGRSTAAELTHVEDEIGLPFGAVWSEQPGLSASDEDEWPLEAGGPTARDVCIAAGKAGLDARRAFCNSALVPPAIKGGCWARALLSRAEWIGWCYWNF